MSWDVALEILAYGAAAYAALLLLAGAAVWVGRDIEDRRRARNAKATR